MGVNVMFPPLLIVNVPISKPGPPLGWSWNQVQGRRGSAAVEIPFDGPGVEVAIALGATLVKEHLAAGCGVVLNQSDVELFAVDIFCVAPVIA